MRTFCLDVLKDRAQLEDIGVGLYENMILKWMLRGTGCENVH